MASLAGPLLIGCARESAQSDQPALRLVVSSPAFAAGQRIPRPYTADGRNISPPLAWQDVPAGTAQIALIVDDPDAPSAQPWVHWLIYKLAPTVTALEQGVAPQATLESPTGAVQGLNSWKQSGYRGPDPPPGKVHHYHFHVYALDRALDLAPGLSADELRQAMHGHILAEGELVGTYARP
jgi:hypothetical protein